MLGIERPDADYWKCYVKDTADLVSRPARWDRRDWLVFGGLAAGAAVIWSQDDEIRDSVLDSRTSASEDLATFGENMGNLCVLVPGLAAGYGLGCAARDTKLKEATLLGAEGLVVSALAANVLKHLVGRARPYVGLGRDELLGPSFEDGYRSWPSGHTAVAFSVATAFHLEYRNKGVSVLAYSLAALAGWSRVHDDMHWASDVFVGATIGTVATRGIFRARGERSGQNRTQVVLTPTGAGIAFRF